MASIPEKPGQSGPNKSGDETFLLFTRGVGAYPDIPDLAARWLEELKTAQLREHDELSKRIEGLEEELDAHSLRTEAQKAQDATEIMLRKMHLARPGGRSQTIRLMLDGPRSARGYKSIAVFERDFRPDQAILAALTILEIGAMDIENLRPAVSQYRCERELEELQKRLWELGKHNTEIKAELTECEADRVRAVRYLLALLRYYRPDFDQLSVERQSALLEDLFDRARALQGAVWQFTAFLEYGERNRDLRPAVEDPGQDVRAAVLKDVDGLTNRDIAQALGIPLPSNYKDKRDISAVRQTVGRGRKLLENTLGKEGWRTQAERMKAEAKRWASLSEEERAEELAKELAKERGITAAEARRAL